MITTNIRAANSDDAEGVLDIYKPIVENTAISFETEVPTIDEIAQRISNALISHAYLIAESADAVTGYAYASQFRPRAAYAKSAEVTVYVHERAKGKNVGKKLYELLFAELRQRGFNSALAGICLPNAASIALHKSTGFERIGVFREVGFKFGKWHDVEWWQKPLKKTG
ncbi:MAG: arsinothricin resistance N-acetyltransferase ArsN1 family B [Pseudomonadota bacterium]